MLKTFKYRIYPNLEQTILIHKHFGCVRWVYNYGLNLKNQTYVQTKKGISRFDIQKNIPLLKKQEETKKKRERTTKFDTVAFLSQKR